MALSTSLATLGWLFAVWALAIALGLPGLLLIGRFAPRLAAAVPALASALAFSACALSAPGLASGLAALGLGLLVALPLVLVLPALRPLEPDTPFLPGAERPDWTSEPFELRGELESRALLLRPRRRRSGICVVILHGAGNDRLYGLWGLLPALLRRGHTVLTAHLPGHGAGGTDQFTVEGTRQRLDSLVEAARDKGGCQRVVLLGQSMGASFALDAVARNTRIDLALAVSPLYRLDLAHVLWELSSFLHPSIYRALRHGTTVQLLPSFGPFRRGRYPIRVAEGDQYVSGVVRILGELDLLGRLPRAKSHPPVTLLHGQRDGIALASGARALHEALEPPAELLVFPHQHHLDILFHPKTLAAILERLDRLVVA